jgi:ferredoxin
MAWKIMAYIGSALALLSLVSLATPVLGTGGYSATTLTMGYCGIVLMAIGAANLFRKRAVFFLSVFLSTTTLYALAIFRYEAVRSATVKNISIIPGTLLFLILVGACSVVILRLNSSLTNKRKLYQTFPSSCSTWARWALWQSTSSRPASIAMLALGHGRLSHRAVPELDCHGAGAVLPLRFIFGHLRCCRQGILRMACPFGYLHDVVDKISIANYTRRDTEHALRGLFRLFTRRRPAEEQKKRGRAPVDSLGYLTYATRTTVFILLLYTAWQYGTTWFCKLCPAGLIEAALPYRLSHNVAPDPLFIWRVVIFSAMIIIAIVVSRFWCRYFCPLGHLAGHFNYVSVVNLSLDATRCTSCGLCKKACPMELNPEAFLREEAEAPSLVKSVACSITKERTNCILCGECVEACKRNTGALVFTFGAAPLKVGRRLHKKPVVPRTRIIEETISREWASFGEGGMPRSRSPIPEVRHEHPVRDEQRAEALEPPPTMRRRATQVDLYVRSATELPRALMRLFETGSYRVGRRDMSADPLAAAYVASHYQGQLQPPIVVVNGQVYTGSMANVSQFLSFVQKIEDSYKDIYIGASAECAACGDQHCKRVLGTAVPRQGELVPFSRFNAPSPGAVLAACKTWGFGRTTARHPLPHDRRTSAGRNSKSR